MSLRSKIIKTGWDHYARWYDRVQPKAIELLHFFGDFSFGEFQERLVELANLRPGDKVLDVACGTGAAHPAIARAIGPRGELIGVDLSSRMLEQAKAKARRLKTSVEYLEADAEELSSVFEKESFDAVISINGLPQFPHPEKALHEMMLVLRPGGRFAVSTISRERCERKIFLWPLMKLAPRLWSSERFRRRVKELGLVHVKIIEEGIMLIITGDKSAHPPRAGRPKGRF
ncbi:MAG: methyltransferase domain-containing protein [Candidatus Abyssobacteria bacterium SURF_5]|uniref:Methyltransferase domain-containing protein n=1 Tax=Abyssobacteria bacterium (strain SURF_5) TaxID=2093360 RepID=A0A3A4NEV1_ABYX5|nr:MAG: methyltransferase domain-containing protein [Candidatus Abyssubacteria bacterium SURF_5]